MYGHQFAPSLEDFSGAYDVIIKEEKGPWERRNAIG